MKTVQRTRNVSCWNCGGSGRVEDFNYNSDGYKLSSKGMSRCGHCNGSGTLQETYNEELCENQTEYDQQMVKYNELIAHNSKCASTKPDYNNHYKSRYGDGSDDASYDNARRQREAEQSKPKKGW